MPWFRLTEGACGQCLGAALSARGGWPAMTGGRLPIMLEFLQKNQRF